MPHEEVTPAIQESAPESRVAAIGAEVVRMSRCRPIITGIKNIWTIILNGDAGEALKASANHLH